METLINALKGTPWWVYILFGYLTYVGIKAKKPHMVSINKMFILPLLFLGWSIYGLIAGFEGWFDILLYLIAGVGGFFIGQVYLKPSKKLRADRKKLLAYLPGTNIVLYLVLSIFIVKYLIGYYTATHETVFYPIHLLSVLVSGGAAGIFIGRTRAFLLKFSKTKHENLKKGTNPRKKSLL